jgi:biofilm PGA synthesis N-glycosyltransferase PgaC
MQTPRYIVVSPMKNEEKHVLKTLNSMAVQTVKPVEWVIVNDGSTDASPNIVADFSERFPWIRLLNLAGLGERLPEHYGGHVVDLIKEGLAYVRSKHFDYVVKLDCDISFEKHFFEKILSAFERDPKLGISSGVSFIVKGGQLVEEKAAENHTLGATKVYRKDCFLQINGLVPAMGWDGIDEIKARMKGWEARPIRDLIFVHDRPEGMASGLLSSGVERGKGSYYMGYHPLFLIARACWRMAKPGLFADGVGLLAGYFSSMFRRGERIPDPEFVCFLRKQQLRKLLLLRSAV